MWPRLTESRLSGLLSGLCLGVEAVNGGCAAVKHILWLREWSVRALLFCLLSWSCNEASGTMLRALHLTQRAFLALFTLGTLFTVCVGALTGKLIPVTPQLALKRKYLQQNTLIRIVNVIFIHVSIKYKMERINPQIKAHPQLTL